MWKTHAPALWVALVLIAVGCSKSDKAVPTPQGSAVASASGGTSEAGRRLDGPAGAVHEFLEAVRTGNDPKATQMLSSLAREKTAALNRSVTPPASDTARFTVGKVELLGEDGARVSCTWTDMDVDGQPKTDRAVWVVRRESESWRIAGVAAQVFPGEPPLLLNFEDPEDMFRKQQWVREEIRRRTAEENIDMQAQSEENPENVLRR